MLEERIPLSLLALASLPLTVMLVNLLCGTFMVVETSVIVYLLLELWDYIYSLHSFSTYFVL